MGYIHTSMLITTQNWKMPIIELGLIIFYGSNIKLLIHGRLNYWIASADFKASLTQSDLMLRIKCDMWEDSQPIYV